MRIALGSLLATTAGCRSARYFFLVPWTRNATALRTLTTRTNAPRNLSTPSHPQARESTGPCIVDPSAVRRKRAGHDDACAGADCPSFQPSRSVYRNPAFPVRNGLCPRRMAVAKGLPKCLKIWAVADELPGAYVCLLP